MRLPIQKNKKSTSLHLKFLFCDYLVLQRTVRQLATNISPENAQNAYKMGFPMPKIECKKDRKYQPCAVILVTLDMYNHPRAVVTWLYKKRDICISEHGGASTTERLYLRYGSLVGTGAIEETVVTSISKISR